MKKTKNNFPQVNFYLHPAIRLTSLFENRGICVLSPGKATTEDTNEKTVDYDKEFIDL